MSGRQFRALAGVFVEKIRDLTLLLVLHQDVRDLEVIEDPESLFVGRAPVQEHVHGLEASRPILHQRVLVVQRHHARPERRDRPGQHRVAEHHRVRPRDLPDALRVAHERAPRVLRPSERFENSRQESSMLMYALSPSVTATSSEPP